MQPRHNTRGESSPDHDDPSSALFDDDSVQLCSFVSLLTDGSDLISSIGKWTGLKTRKKWASESRSLEHFMLCKYLIIVEMFSCHPLLPSSSPLYLISAKILEKQQKHKEQLLMILMETLFMHHFWNDFSRLSKYMYNEWSTKQTSRWQAPSLSPRGIKILCESSTHLSVKIQPNQLWLYKILTFC